MIFDILETDQGESDLLLCGVVVGKVRDLNWHLRPAADKMVTSWQAKCRFPDFDPEVNLSECLFTSQNEAVAAIEMKLFALVDTFTMKASYDSNRPENGVLSLGVQTSNDQQPNGVQTDTEKPADEVGKGDVGSGVNETGKNLVDVSVDGGKEGGSPKDSSSVLSLASTKPALDFADKTPSKSKGKR